MAKALQMPLLQSDCPRLTSNMIADAKRAIDHFATRRWLKLKTVCMCHLPSVCYLPSRIQHNLFQNFHAIHSREGLALVLFDWEFVNLEDNLYGLFDLIHKINTTLDENRVVKKLNQSTKAQEN